jgi:carboxypeptidase D
MRRPTLGLKTKNSWAGLIPATADKESSFFFWMWGNDGPKGSDSIVIWMNGGPGCSSLYGMMIENGPFLYPSVKGKPFPNEYSWTKEAIMVYLEMPIGTGFTTGEPGILNENNVARQFAIWLDNFFAIFPELKGKRVFLAAESYGGICECHTPPFLSRSSHLHPYMAVAPYIMNHLYDLGNKVNLQGAMLVSGLVSTRAAQEDLAAYDFAVKWANTLKLTKEDLTKVKKESDQCGYTDYLEKNLIYPPRGRLPAFNLDTCGTISTLWNVSDARLPGFNPCECARRAAERCAMELTSATSLSQTASLCLTRSMTIHWAILMQRCRSPISSTMQHCRTTYMHLVKSGMYATLTRCTSMVTRASRQISILRILRIC